MDALRRPAATAEFVPGQRMKQGNRRAAPEHTLTLLDEGAPNAAQLTGDVVPAAESDGSGKPPSGGEFDGSGVRIPLVTGAPPHG
ncbi:hypothetical protein [Streptomyces sp. B1I3]|uniref:hypothetical protein n=1 Tax=Streptomyces sp. B1I3 TaxID=3042264 RepID=UPI0027852D7A|nr:hypothetical protein [Streptomyces sp. B1I3]